MKIVVTCVGGLALLAAQIAGSRAAASNDERVVAALDTEYQAAVQKNDAATMDRIMSDDFVLVTGRGNVSSKERRVGKACRSRRSS